MPLLLLFRKRSRQFARLTCKRVRCRFGAYQPFSACACGALESIVYTTARNGGVARWLILQRHPFYYIGGGIVSFTALLITAVGLSMDAFAVAMCLGLSMKRFRLSDACIVGGYFSFFQAFMPAIGYFLGINFADMIQSYDHWVAFIILAILGLKMMYEALSGDEEMKNADVRNARSMLILSIATSIDALAVGISFAMLQVKIFESVLLIGVTTFIISAIGVKIGSVFGRRFKSRAELLGGFILIGIGLKILVEHLSA